MKFKLNCSDENNALLTEKLGNAGFLITKKAPFIISENQHGSNSLLGCNKGRYQWFNYKVIIYIESFGKEIHMHVKDDSTVYHLDQKLFELEAILKEAGFIRVNKSQLINIRFIKNITPWIGQKFLVKLDDDTHIDVNRTYYKSFKNYIGF